MNPNVRERIQQVYSLGDRFGYKEQEPLNTRGLNEIDIYFCLLLVGAHGTPRCRRPSSFYFTTPRWVALATGSEVAASALQGARLRRTEGAPHGLYRLSRGALRGASSPLCPSHGPGLSHGAWGTRPLLSGSRLQLETGKRKGHVTGNGKDDTGGKPPQQAGSSQKKANEMGKQTLGKVITMDNKQQYICLKRLNSPGILCPWQQILKIHKYEDIRRN